jgi:hypothetical protein
LLNAGADRLIEDFEQLARTIPRLGRGASQRRDARDILRSGHHTEQASGHTQADALSLSDTGELVLFVRGDLDSLLQPLLKGLDLGSLLSELLLKGVDP